MTKYELIDKLRKELYLKSNSISVNEGSLMDYGIICQCDEGFLCNHRLEKILSLIDDIEDYDCSDDLKEMDAKN